MKTQLPNPFVHVGGYRRLAPQQIIRLVADRNYTLIYETNGRNFLVSTTLKVIEGRLKAYGFVRINRGMIINMAFVKMIWKDGTIQLTDGTKVYPSRRRQGILRENALLP